MEEERRSPGKGLSGGAGGEQAGQAATSQGAEGDEGGNRRFVYMNGSSGEGQQAAEGEASGPPPQVRSPVKGMGGGAAVPPPAPPPPATPSGGKFRAFLDKRRFDTTIAPAARAYREEDQIKVGQAQAQTTTHQARQPTDACDATAPPWLCRCWSCRRASV